MFRRNVHIPENVDWSERAIPGEAARAISNMGAFNAAGFLAADKMRVRIAQENKAWMKQQLKENEGRVVGYHGTSSTVAGEIAVNGFQNSVNAEGRRGVSAWHPVAAGRAAAFAEDRAQMHEDAEGKGVVFEIAMTNPKVDHLGRLEWLADAGKVEILRSWPAAEFAADHEAAISASIGAMALSEEVV